MAVIGDMTPVVLPFLVGICLWALAGLVLKTGGDRHNRIFASLYLLSGLKSFAEGLSLDIDGPGPYVALANQYHADAPLFPSVATLQDLSAICISLMLPLLVWFLLSFPHPIKPLARHPARGFLILLPSLIPIWVVYAKPDWATLFFTNYAILATVVTMAAVGVLVHTRLSATEPIERKQASYLLLGFLPAFVATWLITAEGAGLYYANVDVLGFDNYLIAALYVSPLLEVVAAAFTAYAILKYRILGAELKVKGGLKYGLMTIVVFSVIFAITWSVENPLLQDRFFAFAGDTGSSMISAFVTVLIFKPVDKLSNKVTDRLFPETMKDAAGYQRGRARDIYRSQVTYVLRDANVTDREWEFLHGLRDQLGLAADEARLIEEEAEKRLGVDSRRTGLETASPREPDSVLEMLEQAGPTEEETDQPATGPAGAPGGDKEPPK